MHGAMTQPFDEPFFLRTPSGATLAIRHSPAIGEPRGILMVQHGMAEHSARYGRFAEAMAARGMHVYVHDHRGHGATTAPDAPIGQFARRDGWRHVLTDAKAVHSEATLRHPGLPVIVLGHSMGGLIALNFAISHPDAMRGIAVWNANFNAGLTGRAAQAILRIERAFKGSDVPSTILPRLTFEAWGKSVADRRTLFDWLSHDPTVVDAYIADPLCGFDASVSLWRDVFRLIYRGADPGNWERLGRGLPVHMIGGGQDPATEGGKAVLWLADRLSAAGFHDVTLTIEEELRHETLNEIGAERPIANFATWVDRVVSA
jgi:alpha-beta hydrolase superfamily lysophospholipase